MDSGWLFKQYWTKYRNINVYLISTFSKLK